MELQLQFLRARVVSHGPIGLIMRAQPSRKIVWVAAARPQTHHFFGDSRRGNILVLSTLAIILLLTLNHHRKSTSHSKSSFDSVQKKHKKLHLNLEQTFSISANTVDSVENNFHYHFHKLRLFAIAPIVII